MGATTIVIPTYNERENIETLVKAIFKLSIPDLLVRIIDDNSPDHTGEIADKLARQYPLVVTHRDKRHGIGDAYKEVFHFLGQLPEQDKPEYIIHMDADLSHNPEVIPRMLEEIKEYDVVIGSRYIFGGKIENWNLLRRMISYTGNVYVRLVLKMPYKDVTGGFRCYRRSTLEAINWGQLSSNGYSFLLESAYAMYTKRCNVLEIPITFTERKKGSSKMNVAGNILESFFKVLKLRFSHISCHEL